LSDHRKQLKEEFESKATILSQGQKYYSDEAKEFSLFSPNFGLKNALQGKITEDFFEFRNDLEDGNAYLLTKVNKMLNGTLMRKWKNLQDVQK
jgi:hypothetical protein